MTPIYKYQHLIDSDKLNWNYLSRNENAIHLLEQNSNKINWSWLSLNPKAIKILTQNSNKIEWHCLSENENAIPILEKNLDKIDWQNLSTNKNAMPILKKNIHKIDFYALSRNTHPDAISILETYLLSSTIDEEFWSYLAMRPHLITIIEKNLDKIKHMKMVK